MKRKQALIAAALMTVVVALSLLAVGVNAALNPNSVPVSNSPTTALAVSSTSAEGQINQLKSLITQYQAREKQYQQQLSTVNGQVQQLQSVLVQLQQAGVISIQNDGTITLGRGR